MLIAPGLRYRDVLRCVGKRVGRHCSKRNGLQEYRSLLLPRAPVRKTITSVRGVFQKKLKACGDFDFSNVYRADARRSAAQQLCCACSVIAGVGALGGFHQKKRRHRAAQKGRHLRKSEMARPGVDVPDGCARRRRIWAELRATDVSTLKASMARARAATVKPAS